MNARNMNESSKTDWDRIGAMSRPGHSEILYRRASTMRNFMPLIGAPPL